MVLVEKDLAVLDALAALKDKRTTIQERIAQMEQRRTEVAAAIYLRVRADYETQVRGLESEEAPLKLKARELYSQLRDSLYQVERENADITLGLQELEFRHSLGEFSDADFHGRKKDIEARLAEKADAHHKAKAMRERFTQAMSEAELEADSNATMAVTPVPPPAPVVASDTKPMEPVAPAVPVPPPVAAYTPIPPPAQNSFAQDFAFPPPPAPNSFANDAPRFDPPPPVKPEVKKSANPDATVVFRPGKLVPVNPEAGMAPTTLSLKPIMIGADNACDVRITAPGIAPRHVSITLSRAGFMLKDLAGSAVTIDGLSVTEQLLRDGDTVQIGPARFTFKLV
jgi:hypothetical protein